MVFLCSGETLHATVCEVQGRGFHISPPSPRRLPEGGPGPSFQVALKGYGAESLHGWAGQSCGAAAGQGATANGAHQWRGPRQLFAAPPAQERGPETSSPLLLLRRASASRPSRPLPVPLPLCMGADGSHPRSSARSRLRRQGPIRFGRSFSRHPQSTSAASPPSLLRGRRVSDARPEGPRGLVEEVAFFWHESFAYTAEPVFRAGPLKAWSRDQRRHPRRPFRTQTLRPAPHRCVLPGFSGLVRTSELEKLWSAACFCSAGEALCTFGLLLLVVSFPLRSSAASLRSPAGDAPSGCRDWQKRPSSVALPPSVPSRNNQILPLRELHLDLAHGLSERSCLSPEEVRARRWARGWESRAREEPQREGTQGRFPSLPGAGGQWPPDVRARPSDALFLFFIKSSAFFFFLL